MTIRTSYNEGKSFKKYISSAEFVKTIQNYLLYDKDTESYVKLGTLGGVGGGAGKIGKIKRGNH